MTKEDYLTPFSNLKNKTGKHKDWYSPDFVKIFCQEINPQNKLFDNKKFLKTFTRSYKECELKQRLDLVAQTFDEAFEASYEEKLKVLKRLLGPRLPFEEGMFTLCFFLYPVSQFIELNAEKNIDESLRFIEELTMRFTGEWAIRPLANLNESKVLSQMKVWAQHENFHVRRLASEGLRARLPWGKKIVWVDKNPKKTLPIYNKLRNDPVLYVRRSVANSMGDMIKLNEDLAYETFQSWLSKKKTKENLWVIKHAIRSPVKKQNQRFVDLKKDLVKLIRER